ncbi:MAG: serine hydrolase [Flavobacteriales bacterium]|jgi:CubicO group peptidase (beta-lactamase class C family)|nr:serine hydrolase [Flavobacteriales bacterium]
MKHIILILLVLPNFIWSQGSEIRLDSIFEKSIESWNIPGMSVGIVKNDSVVLLKGYGVTDVTNPRKVDGNTVFAIASNTKTFTATALSLLVAEGRIDWDDKVEDYLPYFQLYDPYVTHAMTIRDLLCHRSGLETFSGDLIWYGSSYTRKEVIKRAKYLKPRYDFRTQFGYSNIMYIAAGETFKAVSDTSWEDFIHERFLKPLGMTRTYFSIEDLKELGNVAMPHNEIGGKNFNIGYLNWDNIGAAGCMNSSARDMCNWLQLQLNNGEYIGKRIINETELLETRVPHINKRIGKGSQAIWPSKHFDAYGLGVEMMDYKGYQIFMHGGGADGMISRTVFVPELDFGFVILTNNSNSLPYALMYTILDEYIGVDKKHDWADMFLEFKTSREDRTKRLDYANEQKRVPNTTTTLPLEKYTGMYHSEVYGDVEVKISHDKLVVQFTKTSIFKGYLTHWHYNTFQIEMKKVPSLRKGKCSFIIDEMGEVEEMRIDIPNPDFNFRELKLKKVKRK